MRCSIALSCIALAALAAPSLAEPSSVHVDGATIRYDAARYAATTSARGTVFTPLPSTKDLAPVTVRVLSGSEESCDALTLRAFNPDLYAVEYLQSFPITVGGVKGVRMSAHTRCRNATPIGEGACVTEGGRSYLLESVQASCRGVNPFTGTDALREIAAGITFENGR
jgi:hypothetical protein